ncbi:MAG: ferritin-like protein [Chitinophagaceae bacterium]|nr:ferritin-like protein [Chitinophagaceae bacterium]
MKKIMSSTASSPRKTAVHKTVDVKTAEPTLLKEFFMDSLKDIYWAEKHLTKAIPKMVKAATTDELKDAFKEHLEVTQGHVARLEKVFELLGKKATAKKCDAMEGITREAESIIAETEQGSYTRDAALIMAAQKVEHYEIATYGSLVHLASTLGENEISSLLKSTLNEEKETDQALTALAENTINQAALNDQE